MGEDERMAITEFLQARLDEIERGENARFTVGRVECPECGNGGHSEESGRATVLCPNGHDVTEQYRAALTPSPDQRVLRDVEAKRAIIAHNEKLHEYARVNPREDAYLFAPGASDVVLKHLAYIWSDHPDYREDWRP